jgi:hypothetical protein
LEILFWRIDAVLGSVHLITHRNKSQNYFFGCSLSWVSS